MGVAYPRLSTGIWFGLVRVGSDRVEWSVDCYLARIGSVRVEWILPWYAQFPWAAALASLIARIVRVLVLFHVGVTVDLWHL